MSPLSRRQAISIVVAGLISAFVVAGLFVFRSYVDSGQDAMDDHAESSLTTADTFSELAQPHTPACSKPAPRTASDYAHLFASVDDREWGAADVAISVPLPDGRIVWLWGDTFSAGRFVHSSAIVQDGGCLHIVNGGAQLLPNVDAHHIYWIRAASAAVDGSPAVILTARAITLTGKGPWGFKDGGYDQLMALEVGKRSNAALVSPLGPRRPSAEPNPGPMYYFGPHHFGYQRRIHRDIRLADGGYLVTTCQNWDDGILHPLADYRPIFSEVGAP